MYIKSVNIKNIRALKTVKMQWENGQQAGWHVIIGDNGVGKTTLLRSIVFALIGDKRANALVKTWGNWVSVDEAKAEIILELSNKGEYHAATDNLVFTRNEPNEPVFLGAEWSFELSGKSKWQHKYPTNWNKDKDWFSAAYGPYRSFEKRAVLKSHINQDDIKLSAHLSCLQDDWAFDSVEMWVQNLLTMGETGNIIKEFAENLLKSEGLLSGGTTFLKIDEIGRLVFTTFEGKEIYTDQLSSGNSSKVSIALDLFFRLVSGYSEGDVLKSIAEGKSTASINLPGVVLIDEIDIHLHPSGQQAMGQWYTKHFPNIQFIVSSHSPLICRACGETGTIWRIASDSGKTRVEQIKGIDRDKLVYGNILDAVSTDLFGKGADRSKEAEEKLKELAELNFKFLYGKITATEEAKRKKLLQIFASDEKN